MKPTERITLWAMSALLALSVVLVCLPGQGSAFVSRHAAQADLHSHHASPDQNGHHQVIQADVGADCPAAAVGGCVMAHCHLGIVADPHVMLTFVAADKTTAGAAEWGVGATPGVNLPPPRPLQV